MIWKILVALTLDGMLLRQTARVSFGRKALLWQSSILLDSFGRRHGLWQTKLQADEWNGRINQKAMSLC